MSRSIPDRWLSYDPHGAVIDGTNILAFKVPLKEEISKNLPLSKQFTPAKLVQDFPHLKYIVDLTNTGRYYHPQDFQTAGIYYHKLMIPGELVPSDEKFKQFCKIMDKFRTNAKNNDIIGVHCTHGVNRTGYLICRYLVQQLGWEPQESVKAFEKARGYPIERKAYVTEVMRAPRTKLDVSNVTLEIANNKPKKSFGRQRMAPGSIASSKLNHRARFTKERPFPLPPRQPFGFGGPPPPPRAFGPRPPILPPPLPERWLDRPRPHGYGMLPLRPAGSGAFPAPRFPPRMPGPPGLAGPSRLPPPNIGPSRLSGPGMPPPRLPGMGPPRLPPPGLAPPRMPPPISYAAACRSGSTLPNARRPLRSEDPGLGPFDQRTMKHANALERRATGPLPKTANILDFTVDTFDENLATTIHP